MRIVKPYEQKVAHYNDSATLCGTYTVGDLFLLFFVRGHCSIIRDAVEPAVCNRLRQ